MVSLVVSEEGPALLLFHSVCLRVVYRSVGMVTLLLKGDVLHDLMKDL